jgi:hypothetical protein
MISKRVGFGPLRIIIYRFIFFMFSGFAVLLFIASWTACGHSEKNSLSF